MQDVLLEDGSFSWGITFFIEALLCLSPRRRCSRNLLAKLPAFSSSLKWYQNSLASCIRWRDAQTGGADLFTGTIIHSHGGTPCQKLTQKPPEVMYSHNCTEYSAMLERQLLAALSLEPPHTCSLMYQQRLQWFMSKPLACGFSSQHDCSPCTTAPPYATVPHSIKHK